MNIKEASTLQLLRELIDREDLIDGPVNRNFKGNWYEALIAIGKDNTASIMLTDDDLEQLTKEHYEKCKKEVCTKSG